MKLYFTPGTCALADHIVLAWIGKRYQIQKVAREERQQPWFLKLNPAAAVPVYEEDGWVLTQNSAILNYLADKFPDAKLGGDGTAKGRAEVNRWLAFVNSDMHPAFKPLFNSTAYLEDPVAIEKTKRTRARRCARCSSASMRNLQDATGWSACARSSIRISSSRYGGRRGRTSICRGSIISRGFSSRWKTTPA
jgi:glutathione S-transferase